MVTNGRWRKKKMHGNTRAPMLFRAGGVLPTGTSRWTEVAASFDHEETSNEGQQPCVVTAETAALCAVGIGNVLTIVKRDDASSTDIEFDAPLQALCWSVDGAGLVVGDERGSLHFVTPDGDVLFSHGLLSSK